MTDQSPEQGPSPRILTRALQSACEANDPDRARKALVDYLQQRFPTMTVVQALREIENVTPGIEAEVQKLDRSLYGPGAKSPESSWQGKDLWTLIRQSMDVATPRPHGNRLVQLYPGG